MIKYNQEELRDRIYACWVGKNIGGTMGTPYEGGQQINDIQGFSTPKGVQLPNDDLDLQLVWLRAMDEMGPEQVDAKVLAEYWCSFIGPSWNEYGVGKSMMRAGLVPPMSGELYNEEWKHSNGAWIRTEVWACLYPGNPEKAIRYAFEDACCDHGFGEGSYAAIFVAAMEASAFIFNDIRTLISIGLSKIPKDCMVTRSVELVIDCYDKGISWQETREKVVALNKELGWFQAPANIAFLVIGLLYGEGDFKQSMITAINCGDDTDCTGATLGSLMGIMHGTKCIPEDWAEHIGDDIVTISIIKGHGYFPGTCTELTDCIFNLLPVTMRSPNALAAKGKHAFVLTDEASSFSGITPESLSGSEFTDRMFSRKPYSFTAENTYLSVLVEYANEPVIAAEGELEVAFTASLRDNMHDQKLVGLRIFLPEGWTASGRRHVHVSAPSGPHGPVCWSGELGHSTATIWIRANDQVNASNHVLVDFNVEGRPTSLPVSLTILG